MQIDGNCFPIDAGRKVRCLSTARCPLQFLQDRLDAKLAVSTLRVYVAAISAQHVRLGNQTVGSHCKGAQCQMPQLMRVPSWDLPLVLEALCQPLWALGAVWIKLAVWQDSLSASNCISKAGEGAPGPVREPGLYELERWWFRGESVAEPLIFTQEDACLSCQSVHPIPHTYKTKGLPVPFKVKCHSTRSVSASWVAWRGVPLQNIMCGGDQGQCVNGPIYRVNVAVPHAVAAAVLPRPAACSQWGGCREFIEP